MKSKRINLDRDDSWGNVGRGEENFTFIQDYEEFYTFLQCHQKFLLIVGDGDCRVSDSSLTYSGCGLSSLLT